ncbi:MAG: HEPN domain-containing protein [Alphaproteobacteria bacterium]|nr:HEPN domain-containing protein [Alphaproteobacteria bacterium]
MNAVVEGYFAVLDEDLAAARQLIAVLPRIGAFHLQQAAEKLVKAILSAEALHAGADHHIGRLVASLPEGHEWKADLMELDYLSQFATAFRYPSETGRIKPAPDRAKLEAFAELIATLADDARRWCDARDDGTSPP